MDSNKKPESRPPETTASRVKVEARDTAVTETSGMRSADAAHALSRRGFLGTAAAGLAAGTASVLGCTSDETSFAGAEAEGSWDLDADVVLVGTGTGLVGGIAAVVAGAKVLALEKRAVVGGSTGHSGGVLWIPNNPHMAAEGIEDSRANALTYLTKLAEGQADPDLLGAFVDAGPEMVAFLEAHSPLRFRVSTIMGENADYHPEWPGAVKKGRSIEPITDRQGLLGPELIEGLRQGFEAAGGQILLETPAQKLITRETSEGREVIGVEALQGDKTLRIRARRGVHLAAGGFDWNLEMKKHFLRGPSTYTLGASGNEGDGIQMAMAVGADLRNMNEVWGISVYKGEAEPVAKHRMGATLNAEIEKRTAGSIVVNAHGERFHNEAADYDSTWRSYHTWENWGDMGYRNMPAFLLFDSKVRKNGKIAGMDASSPLPDWVIQAGSLSELAEKVGIDVQGLTRTVARFNVYASELRDPDFRRGESSYDRYGMDDKGITLAPLDQAPFFAAELAPADLGTAGGARVNAQAQVLDPFGRVIPGLYASGNNAGVGSPGTSYGGGGGTIGPAMTFAFLAGRSLGAQTESRTSSTTMREAVHSPVSAVAHKLRTTSKESTQA